MELPVPQFLDDDCGCDPSLPSVEAPIELYDETAVDQSDDGSLESASVASPDSDQSDDEVIEREDVSHTPMPSLLKRFANWLSVSNQTQS